MEIRIGQEKGKEVPVYLELDLSSKESFDNVYRDALAQAVESQIVAAENLEAHIDEMTSLDFIDMYRPIGDRVDSYNAALYRIDGTKVMCPISFINNPDFTTPAYEGIMMGMKLMAEDEFGGEQSEEKDEFLDKLHEGIIYTREEEF